MEILRLSHADVTVTDLDLASASRTEVSGMVQLADVVVDGSLEGILKPDPRFYQLAAGRPGVRCQDVVFLDDQPVNLVGSSRCRDDGRAGPCHRRGCVVPACP